MANERVTKLKLKFSNKKSELQGMSVRQIFSVNFSDHLQYLMSNVTVASNLFFTKGTVSTVLVTVFSLSVWMAWIWVDCIKFWLRRYLVPDVWNLEDCRSVCPHCFSSLVSTSRLAPLLSASDSIFNKLGIVYKQSICGSKNWKRVRYEMVIDVLLQEFSQRISDDSTIIHFEQHVVVRKVVHSSTTRYKQDS